MEVMVDIVDSVEKDAIEAIFLRVLPRDFLFLDLSRMIFIMKLMKKFTPESPLHVPHALHPESLL